MGMTSRTSVHTSDGSATSTASTLQWVLVSAGATGGAWQLNDSTDDGGTDLVSGVAPANGGYFINLTAAPVQFSTGIRVDIVGSNLTLTVGYSS